MAWAYTVKVPKDDTYPRNKFREVSHENLREINLHPKHCLWMNFIRNQTWLPFIYTFHLMFRARIKNIDLCILEVSHSSGMSFYTICSRLAGKFSTKYVAENMLKLCFVRVYKIFNFRYSWLNFVSSGFEKLTNKLNKLTKKGFRSLDRYCFWKLRGSFSRFGIGGRRGETLEKTARSLIMTTN